MGADGSEHVGEPSALRSEIPGHAIAQSLAPSGSGDRRKQARVDEPMCGSARGDSQRIPHQRCRAGWVQDGCSALRLHRWGGIAYVPLGPDDARYRRCRKLEGGAHGSTDPWCTGPRTDPTLNAEHRLPLQPPGTHFEERIYGPPYRRRGGRYAHDTLGLRAFPRYRRLTHPFKGVAQTVPDTIVSRFGGHGGSAQVGSDRLYARSGSSL